MALVREVMALSIPVTSIVCVNGSTSTSTGVARAWEMAKAEAIKLLAAVITSSPGPMSYARRASSNAEVPESRPTAYRASQKAANSSSKRRTSRPRIKSASWITLDVASLISSAIVRYCAVRSTKGICGGCFVCIDICVDMITFAFYLHLQSLAFDGPIHGFENSHNIPSLDSAANRALPGPDAFQEMAALVLERLDRFDARADNVA